MEVDDVEAQKMAKKVLRKARDVVRKHTRLGKP